MKNFSEFILEAEIAWNSGRLKGSGKSPSDTAAQKISQVSRQMTARGTTPQKMVQIAQRVKTMRSAVSGASEVAKARDPRPENKDAGRTNTKISGYASKPRDVVSKVGTTSDVQRSDLPGERDTITQNRYTKSGTAGGRGTNISRTGRTYGTRGNPKNL
jgi:hypothetical protein